MDSAPEVIEQAVVFERAAGHRLVAAERCVLAWPDLFHTELLETELALRKEGPLFIALARFDAADWSPDVAARFAFWAERSGGLAVRVSDFDLRQRATFLTQLEQCDHRRERVNADGLAGSIDGLVAAAGITRDRRRFERIVQQVQVVHGAIATVSWDVAARGLFVVSDRLPPIGEAFEASITIEGIREPFAARGRVAHLRRIANPFTGQPAGFGLALRSPPTALLEALARLCSSVGMTPRAREEEDAPDRFTVSFATSQELAAEAPTILIGGLFLRTDRVLELQDEIDVQLELPDGSRHPARGTVVSIEQAGAGLELHFEPAAREALVKAVEHNAPAQQIEASRLSLVDLIEDVALVVAQRVQPRVGNYELLSLLGRGGMAEVYYARVINGPRAGQPVAIKRLIPELAKNSEAAALFVAEGEILGGLDHPNIVKTFEVGSVGGQAYLVMEMVDGRDLGQVVRRCKERGIFLPIDFTCFLLKSLLDALEAVHQARAPQGAALNLVHCDVSPHNLFISRSGEIKLGDFGLAQPASRTAKVRGKPAYLSPEALDGEVSLQADLWAVAVSAYELLTLEVPFKGESLDEQLSAIRKLRWMPARKLRGDLPDALEEVLARAFEKKQHKRYPSSAAFAAALTAHFDADVGNPLAIAAVVRGLFPSADAPTR